MQDPRYAQYKFRDGDGKFHTVFQRHLVTAGHGAHLGGEHRAAGVLETLSRIDGGLFAHHAFAFDFLHMVIGIGDDPVATDQFYHLFTFVAHGDGVGEDETVVGFLGLFRQVPDPYADLDAIVRQIFHSGISPHFVRQDKRMAQVFPNGPQSYIVQASKTTRPPMKLSSHTNRWIARLVLGLMLFAQGVVAANACDVLGGNVTQAFAAQSEDMAGMHCHDEASSNANACLAHCTQGDQVGIDQLVPSFVAPSIVTLVVDVPATVEITPSYSAARVALDTGPPVSIRFCSFQI